MSESLFDQDELIYREMMAHTPLFAHRKPETIAIWNDLDGGITPEILRHDTVNTVWQIEGSEHSDSRVKYFSGHINEFLLQAEKDSLDVLIIGDLADKIDFQHCINALRAEGLLVQICESSFNLSALKNTQQQLKNAGFQDILPLNFPQPHFVSGWRAAMMAIKEGTIKRPREKDIFNKTFITGYYNLDMHKAAFALPEFMREELMP
ncbi:MAG TPA: hypothetical protein VLI69_07595 [Gammaproteobacteria bacterium]|nr:hypothetical protein [Gammaproteobacteria bacterium]